MVPLTTNATIGLRVDGTATITFDRVYLEGAMDMGHRVSAKGVLRAAESNDRLSMDLAPDLRPLDDRRVGAVAMEGPRNLA